MIIEPAFCSLFSPVEIIKQAVPKTKPNCISRHLKSHSYNGLCIQQHRRKKEHPFLAQRQTMTMGTCNNYLLLQVLLVPTIILLCCNVISVQATDIPLGSTLSASDLNQIWSSPNLTFSLNFVPSPSSSSSSFLAAINYNGVSIWEAGGPSATIDSKGSLQLLPSGDLVLSDGASNTIWSSNTSGKGVSSASLEDSGNLLLKNGSFTVWSSFDHPTDCVVPSQNFTTDKVLKNGLYSFTLEQYGNLTLKWNDSIEYWSFGLNSSFSVNLTSPSLGLRATGTLYLSDLMLPSPVNMAYSSDYAEGSDILRFLKLDSDGNLRLYSSALGTGTVSDRWSAVSDQCEVFAYCGNMGICSYNETSPVCGCPSLNFEPIDPRDSRQGCKRKVEIGNCTGSEVMLQLNDAKFLTYPPESLSQSFSAGISACRGNCLSSSSCVASTALSDGSGMCYIKNPGFISGYESPALPGTSFVKVCGPVVENPSATSNSLEGTSKLQAWIVIVVVVATLFGLILLEGSLWWWCCRNSSKFGSLSPQYALLEYASGAPVQFSYKELQKSTRGFKDKLGAGGFGAVYRGTLANRTAVAVKQLEGIEQGEKQFRMEVATISSTHHLNLVRLVGFCSEGRHRLLVYEFMKNRSLDNFLFASEEHPGKFLNWDYRFSIALGTARGITYLHEECRDCIVHCDIKPENILLDENNNAKVSDFGLAKLINPKDHRYRTLKSVRGTRGYLAPEWLANLPITSKSDVYSYGMVLLEIVSGRRNFDVSEDTNGKKFSTWAYEAFEAGNVKAIVDKRLVDHIGMDQALRALKVSFWCIQEQPSQRPMMGRVVQMLEGIIQIENPPAPRAANEGSLGTVSLNISSNISALSTFSPSAPGPSSSSSFLTAGVPSSLTARKVEGASSSLLQSQT